MQRGSVKLWLQWKQFGFIVPEGGGEDVFVHKKALVGVEELYEGDLVTYEETHNGAGKWQATQCFVTGSGGIVINNNPGGDDMDDD